MEVANAGESRTGEPNVGELQIPSAVAMQKRIMTTLLFTIAISASYRGAQEIYSAQVIARNGEKLYNLAEAVSISEALEKIVQEMRLQEKNTASFQ
jgi:hypothetical protein